MSQFGQPPLAALLPLKAGQNLSDVPDKAAALANLGTLSTSDIMLNAVPIGTIIPFWGNTAPVGYLPCNGQTVNSGTFPDLVTFLGGGSSQALPDLRGEFLRGWDNGRGVDTGRAIKTTQLDSLQNITASLYLRSAGPSTAGAIVGGTALFQTTLQSGPSGASQQPASGGTSNTDVTTLDFSRVARTSTETRSRNVSVLYCMKAYGALVNTSTANIGNVLTELSQTVKTTQFENSLGTNGYQKLPSGMIIQWGMSAATTTNINIVFPIAFPNACTSINQHDFSSIGATNMTIFQFRGVTASGVNAYNMGSISSPSGTPSFAGPSAAACLWLATGY